MTVGRAMTVIFLSGLCDREPRGLDWMVVSTFLSGLCDREQVKVGRRAVLTFLSGLCDREH